MEMAIIEQIVEAICCVYRNRGYVTLDEVQLQLDAHNASLIETTRVMSRLDERGCKVVDHHTEEDFEYYTQDASTLQISTKDKIHKFIIKEKVDPIAGLGYSISDNENAMIYYVYLRSSLKITKAAARSHIADLQKAYLLFLGNGEDKFIFDVQSSNFVQQINEELRDRKKHKKVSPAYKSAIVNYQIYLEKNRHRIIANFEELHVKKGEKL